MHPDNTHRWWWQTFVRLAQSNVMHATFHQTTQNDINLHVALTSFWTGVITVTAAAVKTAARLGLKLNSAAASNSKAGAYRAADTWTASCNCTDRQGVS